MQSEIEGEEKTILIVEKLSLKSVKGNPWCYLWWIQVWNCNVFHLGHILGLPVFHVFACPRNFAGLLWNYLECLGRKT